MSAEAIALCAFVAAAVGAPGCIAGMEAVRSLDYFRGFVDGYRLAKRRQKHGRD